MDKLVSGSRSDRPVAAVHHQYSLLIESHSLGNQLLAGGLRPEWQGVNHIPVVVVGDNVQGVFRVNAQHRPHYLKRGHRRFQDVLRSAFHQRIVVIDRYYSFRNRKPLKPGVQIDENLLLGAEHPAGRISNLERVGHTGPGRYIVVATGQKLCLAADCCARFKFDLPVGAPVGLADSFQIDPNFVNFIRPGNLDGEVDTFGEIGFHLVGQHLYFSILGLYRTGWAERGGQGQAAQGCGGYCDRDCDCDRDGCKGRKQAHK